MSKYKMYTLYAKVEGSFCADYTVSEAVLDDIKRGQELMSGNLIEDLDRQTAFYASEEDLLESYPEEVFGENIRIYEPVIIVDKHISDRSKSYPIFDIVYEKEAKDLLERENIRIWLSDYLKNNPSDIEKFRGIRDIFENVKKKYWNRSIEELIDITVFVYFEDDNYKRYREAYFGLKKLELKKVRHKR